MLQRCFLRSFKLRFENSLSLYCLACLAKISIQIQKGIIKKLPIIITTSRWSVGGRKELTLGYVQKNETKKNSGSKGLISSRVVFLT